MPYRQWFNLYVFLASKLNSISNIIKRLLLYLLGMNFNTLFFILCIVVRNNFYNHRWLHDPTILYFPDTNRWFAIVLLEK